MSEYGNFEAGQDSDYFMVHMMAMTTEYLHGKSSVAGELAYRDQRIAELKDACAAQAKLLVKRKRRIKEQAKELDRLWDIEDLCRVFIGNLWPQNETTRALAKALESED